jgi:hypothetical protein
MYKLSRSYSDRFIEDIVFRVKSGELSANEARRLYKIGGKMTVYRWLERYGCELPKHGRYKMVKVKKTAAPKDESQALAEAELRLEYYETLFALASEEYGMDIKKVLATRNRKAVEAGKDGTTLQDSWQEPPSLL